MSLSSFNMFVGGAVEIIAAYFIARFEMRKRQGHYCEL